MVLHQPRKAPSEIFKFDDPAIKYPMYESQKFDGFRLITNGRMHMSPAMKPFPNANLIRKLTDFNEWLWCNGLVADGEIWSPSLTFQQLQSIVRSKTNFVPDSVEYYVFDLLTMWEWNGMKEVRPFHERWSTYLHRLYTQPCPGIIPVFQSIIRTPQEAEERFNMRIASGQEGSMLAHQFAGYKFGRYTKNEGGLFKFKLFETYDGRIVAVNQRRKLKEDITRTASPTGNLERALRNEDYELDEAVGSFEVSYQNTTVNITPGRGFTYEARQNMWQEHQTMGNYVGRQVEFKYMPHGTANKPRMGSLVRFLEDE